MADGAFVPMKSFEDPQGMFQLDIPERYFAIRRKGQDLPNEKGQGRRGSSIFSAGDMAKAEVIAIERYVFVCTTNVVL